MTFTQTALRDTAALAAAIRAMPFNRALADGTLPHPIFRHYIIQDAHYLEGFARALAGAAARAPDAEAVAQLAGSGAGAIAVERQLHSHFMGLYGVDAESFAATPPQPGLLPLRQLSAGNRRHAQHCRDRGGPVALFLGLSRCRPRDPRRSRAGQPLRPSRCVARRGVGSGDCSRAVPFPWPPVRAERNDPRGLAVDDGRMAAAAVAAAGVTGAISGHGPDRLALRDLGKPRWQHGAVTRGGRR